MESSAKTKNPLTTALLVATFHRRGMLRVNKTLQAASHCTVPISEAVSVRREGTSSC